MLSLILGGPVGQGRGVGRGVLWMARLKVLNVAPKGVFRDLTHSHLPFYPQSPGNPWG